MKTIFRSQELWDMVENGVAESKDEAIEKNNRKRDVHAMCMIQQALDRIAEAKTAHET